jgi:hypothetical protein
MVEFVKPCAEEFHEVVKNLREFADAQAEYNTLRHECEIHENKWACETSSNVARRREAARRLIESKEDDFIHCLGRMLQIVGGET